VLGGCWLHFKTAALLQEFTVRTLRIALPVFIATFSATAVISFSIQPGIGAVWQMHFILLTTVSGTMLVAALILFGSINRRPDVRPFAAGVVMIAAGIVGLAILVFPNIVPFRVSLWDASARFSC